MSGLAGKGLWRRLTALPPVLLVLAAVLLWRLGLGCAQPLRSHGDMVSFRLAGTLAAGDYERMAKLEEGADTPLPFALWTQLENKRVTAAFGGRSATVAVLWVRGDSRLALPVAATVAPGDEEGCLLDSATALKLFGGTDIAGSAVEYDGRTYTVRGVADIPAPTLVLQLPETGELPLENITARGETAAEDLPLRHGLEPELTIRYQTFTRLAAALSALPVATAALLFLVFLWRAKRRNRDYPVRHAALFLALCAAATLLALAALSVIPSEYVPTRWSDFAFWPEMLDSWQADAIALFAAAKLRPELCLLADVGGSCLGLASSALLLAAAAMRSRSTGRLR